MKKRDILKEVYTEKQRKWACWQSGLSTKKRKKGLSKKEAEDMCSDTEYTKRKEETTTPKMKKGDLVEYINSKKYLNEQNREVFLINEIPRGDKVKIFRFFETLRDSGLINMFGAFPILNWTRDDLERWLYGQSKDIDSIESEIENLEYDNDEGDNDSEIESLQQDLEIINKLLDTKDEIRNILIRAALKRIENTNGDDEISNVQRMFEKMAKESFKMWTSTIYG